MLQKAGRSIGHVVFRGEGRGTSVAVETLPDDQSKLELRACESFVNTLVAIHKRRMTRPSLAPGEFPDCVCREDEREVEIEIAELVAEQKAADEARKSKLAELLASFLYNSSGCWRGTGVQVYDDAAVDQYPDSRSPRGLELLETLKTHLLELEGRVESLSVGKLLFQEWSWAAESCHSAAIVSRFAPEGRDHPPVVQCDPGYSYASAEHGQLLPAVINKKLAKRYGRSAIATRILLIYQLLGPPIVESDFPDAYANSRQMLNEDSHAFDEAWYCWLMAHHETCPVTLIWQRDA